MPRPTTLFAVATLVLLLPALHAQADDPVPVSDGRTPIMTPQGTWIVPPPGAPMRIIQEDPANVHQAPKARAWTVADVSASALSPDGSTLSASGELTTTASCVPYQVGWYATDSSSLHGGHMGIVPRNMPPDTQHFCANAGMGYTDGVSFGTDSWIQAGLAIFPGETKAKWFCQSSDHGARDTRYGTVNAYNNGATVYTWFSRDSSGVWRTYRYDTGPYSVELGCTITRGASGNLQTVGEIQSASSTSAPIGPWEMFDLRYQATNNYWYRPSQVQAFYPYSTPCPPYGAGTVSAGVIIAGSGQACTTGTSPYPN